MTAPTPQQIAETLAEHGALGYDDVDGCECGVEVRTHEAHRVHVAEQLAALWPQRETSEGLAQAWERGVGVGYHHAQAEEEADRPLPLPPNPYRQPVPDDTDGGE